MGKRIERIFAKDISGKIDYLLNNMITVILKNNTSLRGHLTAFDHKIMFIKQKANSPQKVEIDLISEIQIDKHTDW